MAIISTPRRSAASQLPLLLSLMLFGLFGALAAHQIQVRKSHKVGDVELVKQLSSGEILPEPPPPASQAAEWPQWRGLRRDGVAHTDHLLTDWPRQGPTRLWSAEGGESYSSFAVAGGRLYTMMHKDEQEQIVCLKADTGDEIWRQGYPRPAARIEYGNWPRATPTLDGDRVYTVGPTGRFQCRSIADGELRWEKDLLTEYGAKLPKWGMTFSPLIERNLVIATPGGAEGNSVVAFDKMTGAEVWKALNHPAGYSSPIAITVGDKEERQIVVFTGHSLIGLAAADGKLRWRFTWATDFEVNAATPIAFQARLGDKVEQFVFITSGYKKGCALLNIRSDGQGGFVARRVYENNLLCCHFSSPVRHREYVYGFNETELTCMDIRTGEVRWTKRGYRKGSLILAEDPAGKGTLIVMGEEGTLALLEATPEEPRVLAEARPLRRRCWPLPVLAEGRYYLRDEEQILCLQAIR